MTDLPEVQIDQKWLDEVLPEVIRRSPDDPMFFIDALTIPSGSGPQRYCKCMQPFQREAFEKLMASFQAVSAWKVPAIRRFWIERTKKASKDSDIAAALCWLIAFTKRPIKIQIVASNYRQAAIVENRAIELLHYNPWLKDIVEIVEGLMRRKVQPKEIWARIEATNTGREAQGETPDVLVLNELVHVAKWGVMETHMNNADGVPQGIVIVATNAGIKGTPAWRWRQNALNSKRWWTQFWSKFSPWTNEDDRQEAKQRDPIGSEYARLWEGRWISGMGDALSDEEIEAIFTRKGPLRKPKQDWVYFGGLDLGVSKDHAGIAVLGANTRTQKVRIARIKGFAPSLDVNGKLEVNVDEVRQVARYLGKLFRVIWFGYDPASGGSFMAQDLRKHGLNMQEVSFASPRVQTDMATALVQMVKGKHLESWDDKEGRLRRDFAKFNIEHRPPKSYKLVATSDEFGHADVGVAVVMTLPRIVKEMGGFGIFTPDDHLAEVSEKDDWLDDEEVKEMPDELREMYEMEESYLKDMDNWI